MYSIKLRRTKFIIQTLKYQETIIFTRFTIIGPKLYCDKWFFSTFTIFLHEFISTNLHRLQMIYLMLAVFLWYFIMIHQFMSI